MGDWRTLHLFDKTKYIKEVVPRVKNLETYLPVFLNKRHSKWLNGFTRPAEEIIEDTIKLVSELDEELSCHIDLIKLSQVTNKKYDNFYLPRDNFIRQRQMSIEFFEYLMIETIFLHVANFNPYFILGKQIFEGAIETKENSIAEELTCKIVSQNKSSILDVIDGGIINWLSEEEVTLLYLDRENIKSSNIECLDYVNEFKELLKYATEKNLGLISLRNPREDELSKIHNINYSDEILSIVRSNNYKHIIIVDNK